MSKTRKERGEAEWREDSKILSYEARQLLGAAKNLASPARESDWAAGNADVESFALHCRNLLHFFFYHVKDIYRRAPQENDVIARDFFLGEEEWPSLCPEVTESLRRIKERADKQVAHMTTERRGLCHNPDKKTWPVKQILSDLRHTLAEFLKAVPEAVLPSEVHEELQSVVDGIRELGDEPVEVHTSHTIKSVFVHTSKGSP